MKVNRLFQLIASFAFATVVAFTCLVGAAHAASPDLFTLGPEEIKEVQLNPPEEFEVFIENPSSEFEVVFVGTECGLQNLIVPPNDIAVGFFYDCGGDSAIFENIGGGSGLVDVEIKSFSLR